MDQKIKELTDRLCLEVRQALANGGKWKSGMTGVAGMKAPRNALTNHRYQGCNSLGLWLEQQRHGYRSNLWFTFKQKEELARKRNQPLLLKEGSECSHIVKVLAYIPKSFELRGDKYYDPQHDALLTKKQAERTNLRVSRVFNVAQLADPPLDLVPPVVERPLSETAAAVKAFYDKVGPVTEEGLQASYNTMRDVITLPPHHLFTDDAFYCGTLTHELVHWTGHKSRLDRPMGAATRNFENYCREELVAEIGALFLCIEFGVPPTFAHAEYAASYVQHLQGDDRTIIDAASAAQKAAQFLYEKGAHVTDGTNDAPPPEAVARAA